MRKMIRAAALVLALLLVPVLNCNAQAETLQVVCTSFPCYDFVRAVVGELAEIHLLIKPGSEVHSYEPTPSDVITIAECDLFVYVGGESDAWAVDILDSFGADAPRVLRFYDYMEHPVESAHAHHEGEIHGDDHDHAAQYDEHIWTSPVNAQMMVAAVRDEICGISPSNAEEFAANAAAYIAQIEEIHAAFTEIVENGVRRELIFADRFPFLYFAREYDIEWHAAFDSCSSESEPSAKTMMELIDRIITDRIPVVYTIELSNGKTARTLADETGVEICTFHSVQNVTEAEFSAGESYVSLMQKNVEALKKGLYE